MLHMNGVDGSQTFTDSSASAHTVTANGNAQIDTAQYKWTASGLFDGNGDYLTIPDSDDWYFDGDFTIDCWVDLSSLPSDGIGRGIIGQSQDDNNQWFIRVWNNGGTDYRWQYAARIDGSYSIQCIPDYIPISTDVWYHIAVSRYDNTYRFFINGTTVKTTSSGISLPNYSAALWIGQWCTGNGYFHGWIDELRVSKGIARWTSDFTPPTSEYDPSYDESITDSFSFDESLNEHPCTHTQTIDESFSIDDTSVMIGNYAASISDSLSMDDSFSMAWDKYISDSLSIDDTSNTKIDYHPVAADSFGVDDTNNTNYTTSPTIEETISMQGLYSATLTVPTRRKKQNTNISGKRISLKFSNDTQDHGLYLEDAIIKLHRSKANDTVSMNHIGGHISMKFQNNTIDETIYLEYVNYIIAPLTGR